MHYMKAVNYAVTNSTKTVVFGPFWARFLERSFQLCLGITSFKGDIDVRVLMTLVKFNRHSNLGNIFEGKAFFPSPLSPHPLGC